MPDFLGFCLEAEKAQVGDMAGDSERGLRWDKRQKGRRTYISGGRLLGGRIQLLCCRPHRSLDCHFNGKTARHWKDTVCPTSLKLASCILRHRMLLLCTIRSKGTARVGRQWKGYWIGEDKPRGEEASSRPPQSGVHAALAPRGNSCPRLNFPNVLNWCTLSSFLLKLFHVRQRAAN